VKTGAVRFGYLHLAFLGQESEWAAEASECADEQGKFWEYHDKLFASQKGENQGAFAKEKLKLLAADLNLDMTKFSTCLESGKYASVVQTESQMVGGVGVKSTPTFLVNTEVVQGAQPFELFSKIIEAERGNSK
jgi:protein-disulfide isomerase